MLEILFAGTILWAFAATRWKQALKAAIVLSIFEGAIRKWLLPGASELVYFAKDFLLLGTYTGWLSSNQSRKHTKPRPKNSLDLLLLLACSSIALQILNPNNGSIEANIFGIKTYLWYIPLLWIVKDAFSDEKDLTNFLKLIILLIIPIGTLGILQFYAGPGSWLNVYAKQDARVITFGGASDFVRVTGTFSFMTGYTSYMLLVAGISLPYLLNECTNRLKASVYAATIMLVGNMMMQGARKNIVFLLMIFCAIAVEGSRAKGESQKKLIKGLLGIFLISLIGTTIFSDASTALHRRATTADSITERLNWFWRPFFDINEVPIEGYGPGVTHPARRALDAVLRLPRPNPLARSRGFDFEPDQVLWELGPIGFILWYALKASVVGSAFQAWRTAITPWHRHLAAGAMLYLVAHMYLSTVINHTAHLYYWFLAGIIFMLPDLDARQARKSAPEYQAGQ
ncbi:hypothetical protein [Rhodopirellula sp. SWK7]|uniref:hypothetical protein n=1 Tax=Rhodopirellula sp. SWK7 TaxID=595460 RepID=UPI0002BD680F|nr:hypothetical protein [Rhodopirellula sp. SWK7]EMI41669.1 putative membrane protein [Rhodopirellula sp. SWK7]